MKLETMTINMTLAAYMHEEPDKQVIRMAKRYRRQSVSSSIKRTLRTVISSPKPALLVKRVSDL